MRLGDLDKLKLDLTRPIFDDYEQGVIWSAIDNAPTVEYTFEEAFQKTVCEQRLYCPERPQGEWIDHGRENLLWGQNECPFCHKRSNRDANFCQYCGAYMRGNKE